MYKFSYFTENDAGKVMAFMKDNSFAIITGMDEKYPVATHIPLDIQLVNGEVLFTGHMMKNTDHHKAFTRNENVLVIFNGPHCYVSASWYNKPHVASTWNYMTVHAKGKIVFTDEAGTKDIIENITDKYEDSNSASAFRNLPGEYVSRLVKAIIGFTIKVETFDNVFKLSQNHDEANRLSIVHQLKQNGDDNSRKVAEEMEKRITT